MRAPRSLLAIAALATPASASGGAAAADPPPSEAASPPATPAPPALTEVTVEGDKAPPGSTSLGRRALREVPGVLDDPYRAIEVQPGVTQTASGVPYYFIRGAPPGNIGYFFDGIQVPLLFHVGAGPSVIPPAAIQRVEFHPGPYPASVGRFAGAIIDAESTPPSYQWRGEAAIKLTDLGGIVEGPVRDDLHLFLGGRYSVGASLVGALVPSVDLGYGDYQARVTWTPSPEERWSLFAFGAYDYLATVTGDGAAQKKDTLLDADFHRVDLRYEREARALGKVRASVTLGLDQSRGVGVVRARDLKLNARVSVARPTLAGRALLRGGLDVAVDDYDIQPHPAPVCAGPCTNEDSATAQIEEAYRTLFTSRVDLALGAWADAVLILGPRATLNPGIRVDEFMSLGNTALAVDPKLVGRFGVGEHLNLVPTVGIASQLPGFAPVPAVQIAGIAGGLQRSLQASFGAEVKAGPVELTSTAYRQVTFNLTDPVGTGRGTTLGPERFLTRSLGDAYGLELGARGALRRNIFFLASYTLSRATRTRDGRTVPSAYDRTHMVNLALLFDLGNSWKAGVRHVFYSGFPADEAAPGRLPSEDPPRVRPFYRFDLRISKRWKLGARGYLGLVLDLQNATLAKEVYDVACTEKGCTPKALGPITIPSLVFEAGF